ncbi:peptidase M50B-like-domain-containing protein [Leucosporidium creatinivorum]|uniref:Peptidase M50B-like-domain-containing protein n=1 Tax=Leucosporidium creatinivorum TaxID=106004 RepID=A0A1Y2FW37_9BASI|nr:peptidase M50B-like-domain-containing protein [Leucosporidium creatinivorum]
MDMANLTSRVWLSSQPPPLPLPFSVNSSLQISHSTSSTQPSVSSPIALYYQAEDQPDSRSLLFDDEELLLLSSQSLSLLAPDAQLTAAPVARSASSTFAWSLPTVTRALYSSASLGASPGSALSSVVSPSPTPPPSSRGKASGRLAKRWEGWETETSTLYVTATDDIPTAITVWETYGESPVVDGGTTTITGYQGDSTLTVAGPTYVTLTFYPTTTTYHTERTTIPTSTKTKTSTQAPMATQTICWPGDSSVKERTGLKPTHDQSITLYVIAIYIVGIGIAWNLIGLRELLYPYKTMVIGFHEVGHVLSLICLGGSVGQFSITPDPGGQTRLYNPDPGSPPFPLPLGALPLGFLFNIFIGGLLTFCGFNTLASKIASFILAFCWLGVFFASSGLGKGMTILAAGLMVGLWWADHAWGLRFYVLFIGVMSSFYVLWDVIDDAIFAKENPCCPAQFTLVMPAISPGIFTLVWFFISFIFFIGFVLAGLATWKESHHVLPGAGIPSDVRRREA